MKTKDKRRFPGYTGKRTWHVVHPALCPKGLTVYAPDADSAIPAAASALGVAWTSYDFYSNCEVTRT